MLRCGRKDQTAQPNCMLPQRATDDAMKEATKDRQAPLDHLSVARALAAQGARTKRLGLRKRAHSPDLLRRGLSRATDGLALRLLARSVSNGSDRSKPIQACPPEAEPARHVPVATKAAQTCFPAPDAPAHVAVAPGRQLRDGRIEDLSFPSYYAPQRTKAIELMRRYPQSAMAHLRRLRHREKGRPAIICLHGWGGGQRAVDGRIFNAPELYGMAFDVYLYTHPYHGQRSPQGGAMLAPLHPSLDVDRTNEAFFQTVWEVRTVIRYHQQLGGGQVGVIGLSLGAHVTALLAAVAPALAFALPILPIVDLPALWWAHAKQTGKRESRHARQLPELPDLAGWDFEHACQAMAVHSPLNYAPAIAPDRLMIVAGRDDRIAPPSHGEALWRHWNEPRMHWFGGSHLLHFGRKQYLDDISSFLRNSSLSPSQGAE